MHGWGLVVIGIGYLGYFVVLASLSDFLIKNIDKSNNKILYIVLCLSFIFLSIFIPDFFAPTGGGGSSYYVTFFGLIKGSENDELISLFAALGILCGIIHFLTFIGILSKRHEQKKLKK